MTVNTFPMPTNPVDKKSILDAAKEVSASFTRKEAEGTFVREAVKDLSDKLGIPKKILNKFFRAYHRSNFAEVVADGDEFENFVLALQPKALGVELEQDKD